MNTGRAVKKPPMPFIWDMARHCLELPYGAMRHFPAGNYYAQTAHWIGEAELSLMRIAHNAWFQFGHQRPGDWKAEELNFMDWLRKEPKIEEPPSRRVDMLINWLWRITPYGLKIMENIRRGGRS